MNRVDPTTLFQAGHACSLMPMPRAGAASGSRTPLYAQAGPRLRTERSTRFNIPAIRRPVCLAFLCLLWMAVAACLPTPPQTAPPTQSSVPLETPSPAATYTVNLPLIQASHAPTVTPEPSVTPSVTPMPPLRFAIIGDFGTGNSDAASVADLVKSWAPDFIITTGDNNYPNGEASTIDANIGQFYHEFIHPYTGSYGDGADTNRFFPTLGNHDWNTPGAQPYLDYFTLPGNERYYDLVQGPVHLFALDSDSREPDGVGQSSIQAAWLQNQLAAADAPWKIVYMHHPPYSSGLHGSIEWMRWPFQAWGASIVIAAHDHTYERIELDGFTYIVNGLGGGPRYFFNDPLPGSLVRFNADFGAMLVEATPSSISFQFISVGGETIDVFTFTTPEAAIKSGVQGQIARLGQP